MVIEACVPWEPILEVANNYMQLDVVHLRETCEEAEWTAGISLWIAVAAYWQGEEGETGGAWRINFRGVAAYRRRPLYTGKEIVLTRPTKVLTKSLWEIAPSNYVEESGALGGISKSSGQAMHHYVVVGASDIYEIVAHNWRCEPLPESWARPFDAPIPR